MTTLTNIPKKIRNLKRSREIFNVLVRHGFGHVIERLGLKVPRGKTEKGKDDKTPVAERARLVLEELGPTFVKFGQILSMRPDLIPPEFVREFAKLQDNVPPVGIKQIRSEIRRELEFPVEEIYDSFDRKPIAAASISQVHRAILGGEEVVIKVQRPGIEKEIESDIDILFELARLVEKHIPESQLYDPPGIVNEFAKTIRKELDFMVEARNAERFKRNFTNEPDYFIPSVYWEATTKRVLTMELIRGTKIGKLPKKVSAKTRKQLAEKIARAYLKQILVDGFFHGDPHPGNIYIVDHTTIAFMDFGIVGRIDDYMKGKLSSIFISMIQQDRERIVDEFLDIGIVSEETDVAEFRTDLNNLIDDYYGTSRQQVNIASMMNQSMEIAYKHKIRIPANFALLIKTLVNMESICGELSPDFNLTETMDPFVESLIAERFQPGRVIKKFAENLVEINEQLYTIPRKLNQVLSKLQEGKLLIDIEHKGLGRYISEIDAASNRIAVSLIISALIVGSSVVMLTGQGPLLLGFPAIGVIGYLIAGLLGFGLVISILRSGRI